MLDALQVAQLYQDNARIFEEMDREIARLENETRAAISANPLLMDKIRAQGQTVDYVAKKVAALHEKYALGHARHGLDPLEFLRKVTFDENYARQREAEIAARSAENAQENAAQEAEINEPAAENAPVAEEEAATEDMAAEETAAQDEEALPESANEKDSLLEERWLAELEEETGETISEPAPQAVEESEETPQSEIAANLDAAVEEALE